MALETEKMDRSYQYGRLLAIMEQIESRALYESGETRETNAIRMQSVFIKRPAYTSKILLEKLKNSYYSKLNSKTKNFYEKLIGQIMDVLSRFDDEEYNKPLSETYLMGYYLQKNSFYEKSVNKEENDNE